MSETTRERIISLTTMIVLLLILLGCSAHQQGSVVSRAVGTPTTPTTKGQPSTPSVTADQAIRAVDFANFSFPLPAALRGRRPEAISLHDGALEPTAKQMGFILESVVYGDLTGDQSEEAVVVLSVVTGGSAIPHCVYVYRLKERNLQLLWSFVSGDRADGGLRSAYPIGGALAVELYGQERVVGRAVPSDDEGSFRVFTRTHYVWKNDAFKLQGKPEVVPNESGAGLQMPRAEVKR